MRRRPELSEIIETVSSSYFSSTFNMISFKQREEFCEVLFKSFKDSGYSLSEIEENYLAIDRECRALLIPPKPKDRANWDRRYKAAMTSGKIGAYGHSVPISKEEVDVQDKQDIVEESESDYLSKFKDISSLPEQEDLSHIDFDREITDEDFE